jgi:hypothetical protein
MTACTHWHILVHVIPEQILLVLHHVLTLERSESATVALPSGSAAAHESALNNPCGDVGTLPVEDTNAEPDGVLGAETEAAASTWAGAGTAQSCVCATGAVTPPRRKNVLPCARAAGSFGWGAGEVGTEPTWAVMSATSATRRDDSGAPASAEENTAGSSPTDNI